MVADADMSTWISRKFTLADRLRITVVEVISGSEGGNVVWQVSRQGLVNKLTRPLTDGRISPCKQTKQEDNYS